MPISERCDKEVDPILMVLLSGNDVIMARTPEDTKAMMRDFERNLSMAMDRRVMNPEAAHDMRITLLEVLKVSEKPVSEWPPLPFAPFYVEASEALYDAIVKCECKPK